MYKYKYIFLFETYDYFLFDQGPSVRFIKETKKKTPTNKPSYIMYKRMVDKVPG